MQLIKLSIGKTQNTNHVIFFQVCQSAIKTQNTKNLQKRVRKKGLRYISHPKMKNFRANSCSSDMTQIS